MGKQRGWKAKAGLSLLASLWLVGCHGSPSVTSVTVTADRTALLPAQVATLTASVLGTGDFTPDVQWTIDGDSSGTGLVTVSGQSATYTAPSVATTTSVVIRATSVQSGSVSSTMTLTISVSAGVQVTGSAQSVYGGYTVTFDATSTGSVPGFVWSIDASGPGTLSSTSGSSVVYTAPASVPSQLTVEVRASSSTDPSIFGTATVNLQPVTVVVTSDNSVVRLASGQSLNLNGSVAGPQGVDQGVTWSVQSGPGMLSSSNGSGVTFTAGVVDAETQVTIRAIPSADPTQFTDFTLILDHGWPQVVESIPDSTSNAPQESCIGVAVDYSSFAVYVAGKTAGGHFDVPASLGLEDGYVAKFDAYGNLLWVRQFGTESTDLVTGIAADLNGNVYVGGYTIGRTWTPGPAGPADPGTVGFLLAYDTNGGFLWRQDIGPFSAINTSQCAVFGVTIDQNNNVYAAGSCANPPMGLVQRCTAAGCDGPSGGLLTQTPGTTAFPNPFFTAIAVDAHGVYDLVGSSNGGLQGGGGTPVGFVTQVHPNTSGDAVWVRTLAPTSGGLGLVAVATDGSNVYVGGATDGTLQGQTSQGGQDAVLAVYDALGNPQWALQFGTTADDSISGLLFNPFGSTIIPTGTQNSGGVTQSAFVAFYNFAQTVVSPTVTFDGPNITAMGGGVTAADATGNLFIGYTTGAQFSGPAVLGIHAGVQKLDAFGNPLSL